MARLPKDVVVTSQPLQKFPNGDYLYAELSRVSTLYDCQVKMARGGSPGLSVLVATAQGKTIRQAEASCYSRVRERAPFCPEPPFFKRGARREPAPMVKKAAAKA
ncbi:MAG TPA: hypothetical protein VFY29_16585 [Terriglobia bacterium]|nr:hypothetical protein [Terriglobia bacterium]